MISKAHANTDSISGIEQTNGKLSGRVIDAKGEPIPGANISVKGTTIGTITDMDGNFSIDVNPIKYSPSVLSDMKQKQSLSPTRKH